MGFVKKYITVIGGGGGGKLPAAGLAGINIGLYLLFYFIFNIQGPAAAG